MVMNIEMPKTKSKIILVCSVFLVLLNCGTVQKDAPMEQWFELEFIVDGKSDIRLSVPPAKAEEQLFEPQFVTSSLESYERLFNASYDPGWGRDRDLLLTTLVSSIRRVDLGSINSSDLSLEYIKNNEYLARPNSSKEFEVVGEVTFNERAWLRVNLIGGYRKGISYATVVNGEYILVILVSIYGEDSDKTSLYPIRHETLKKIVNSVKIHTD